MAERISVALMRRVRNMELPLEALRAIVELRRYVDELESDAVAAARSKGASYEDIAGALGITRQALQQRLKKKI